MIPDSVNLFRCRIKFSLSASGIEICKKNAKAIECSDEVHIFYNSNSQGTHFDMGVAFAIWLFINPKIRIKVVKNEDYGKGKSYPRMLMEWEDEC